MQLRSINILDRARVNGAKAAYATRRIPREHMATLVTGDVVPREGDLVLARVEKVGQHQRIELVSGRRSRLFVGDEIALCLGNRYAPDQFEAVIPRKLGQCAMVAAGGIASRVMSQSQKVTGATLIQTLGLVANSEGRVLNLEDYALPEQQLVVAGQVVLVVAGTAMNAGKTETVINLVKGLVHSNYKVGVAKVTGTGAGGDIWAARDAGANPVFDFTDGGLPSTYQMPHDRIESVALNLLAHLSKSDAEIVVLELADGLFQAETARLLASPRFASLIDGIIFAAGDAMGATAGVQWLIDRQLPILGVGGLLTQSPLAMREVVAAMETPVFDMQTLSSPDGAASLVKRFIEQSDLVA